MHMHMCMHRLVKCAKILGQDIKTNISLKKDLLNLQHMFTLVSEADVYGLWTWMSEAVLSHFYESDDWWQMMTTDDNWKKMSAVMPPKNEML